MDAIPERELTAFHTAINAAIYLAWNGRIAAGFLTLREGLERAEVMGEDWASRLAQRYQGAADRYTARYGATLLE